MLLSIIIPAYNVEKYIVSCLDSCYHWTEELADPEKEVIVVDDGSTDSTPALLQQYKIHCPNLKILHQKNQGQSVARNLAIEESKGEYIYMVDADDQMMGYLPLKVARERRFDIIGVQVMYQLENGEKRPWSHQMEHWPFDREYASGADFVRSHNIEGLVYGYLFRRTLFTSHPELRFTPGIYHQDEELIFKLFTLAGRTVYKRGYTYLYYEHSGSSLNTRTEERKRKLMEHHLIILERLTAWRDSHRLQEVMRYKMAFLAMDAVKMLITKRHNPEYATEILHKLQRMRLYPLPWIASVRYLGMKMLTCHPALVRLWIRLNNKVHRTDGQ